MAPGSEVLRFASAFGEVGSRHAAAVALARALGVDEVTLFAPDPDLGVLLPAPGLPQTLRNAVDWRAFLVECRSRGEHVGTLPGPDGQPVPARGCAAGDGVAVLVGGCAAEADLGDLRAVLPLLGTLAVTERRVGAAEAHARAAEEAAERARVLTRALNQMRERLEAALAAAESAREEAERARLAADKANHAKSEFLATMSHELRTPINAVLGYGELLEMGITGPVNADQRLQLQRIRASSRHLLALINDVLDLAKVEAGQLRVVHTRGDAAELVAEAMAVVQAQFQERGVQLQNLCIDEIPYMGDPGRVRQILLNFLSNAVKFTPRGGRVTIRCGITDRPDQEALLEGAGRWTYFHVEDTGIGMAEDVVGRVFQPFVQAEGGHTRTHGGTGLGLTISRQLARLMGGDITVRSEPGRGSGFSLWLPTDIVLTGALDDAIRVRER